MTADLILVDGDPSSNLMTLERVAKVIQDGDLVVPQRPYCSLKLTVRL